MRDESTGGTLLLARRDVAGLMDDNAWLEAVETGFRAAAQGRAVSPPPMTIHGTGGSFHAKGASLDLDRRYVALKLNGNFPGNPAMHGLPTIQGAILLCDGENGSPLAIIDSIEVTLRRTAAATALAARHLARPQSQAVLICGCGGQAPAQLTALAAVLPLRRCLAWDRDAERAAAFAASVAADGRMQARAVATLEEGGSAADVIVTCTTSRTPFLGPQHVRSGTFVAAVGADSPEKSEIEPALMAKARVVPDVLAQCLAMGDLRHAVAAGAMTADAVHAELAAVVTGSRPGRSDEDEITLFDSTGTALQDVAAAAMVYERARGRADLLSIALGAA
jgi:ornithine cyclodeaminase/alanine dehydrogenase-like protein (mu-crystallin family)